MKLIEKTKYIKLMLRPIKAIYIKFDDFMINNRVVKLLVYKQHYYLPMPFPLFDLLYRFKLLRYLLNFYGYHVFFSSYSKREGNDTSYWLSRESLYWHLWRQSDDYDGKIINDIMSLPEIKDYLKNDNLIVLEAGFGIGRNYYKNYNLFAHFKKYIALEINPFCCEYIKKRYASYNNNLDILNISVRELIDDSTIKFDIFICTGVLVCLDKETVDLLFKILPERGVKAVIILNEGTDQDDFVRSDNTTIYNIKNRLIMAGYKNKPSLEKKRQNDVVYEYCIMLADSFPDHLSP